MNVERNLRGDWDVRDLGNGAWLLASRAPGGAELHLIGVRSDAAALPADSQAMQVTLQWSGESVLARLVSSAGVRQLSARSATIHEPLPHLYDALPLERLDRRARRFWRRVFLLVRIPGGRRLLGLVARRAGSRR